MNQYFESTPKPNMDSSWIEILKDEFKKDYMENIRIFLKKIKQTQTIYPPLNLIFNAFTITSFDKVKVVILGQDPYHEEGQAHGLSFSVPHGIRIPPSLRNIFIELKNDLGIVTKTGCLENWGKQGVLLLNSILTVSKGVPAAHRNIGWEIFTDKVLELINLHKKSVVYMLWGNHAKKKTHLIEKKSNLVLESSHPSPFSVDRGFFGSAPFSKCNNFLKKNGKEEIKWNL